MRRAKTVPVDSGLDIGGLFSAWEPDLPRAELERPYFTKRRVTSQLEMCVGGEHVKINWRKIPDAVASTGPTSDSAPRTWAQELEAGVWRVLRALKAEVMANQMHEGTASKIYGRLKYMMRFSFEMQFLVASHLDKLEAAGGSDAIVRAVAKAVDNCDTWVGKHRAEAESLDNMEY